VGNETRSVNDLGYLRLELKLVAMRFIRNNLITY